MTELYTQYRMARRLVTLFTKAGTLKETPARGDREPSVVWGRPPRRTWIYTGIRLEPTTMADS